ncbi:MAG: adenosylcobinamide-phosphate synthase CbiB [Eubacteriaceae bacterium]|nr:adenosylcobinamide-phosphate synthase CbiB [Eubacteriaceae bacterium]
MIRPICLLAGFAIDYFLSEKTLFSHPIILIGKLISSSEAFLRAKFVKKKSDEYFAGFLLAAFVIFITGSIAAMAAWAGALLGTAGTVAVSIYFAFRSMAPKSLYNESIKVYDRLVADDLDGARYNLSMIVGRDTEMLTRSEVAKAAIETIAESTSDGIGGPVFFFALAGPIGCTIYKAINTMDSMIGYKNEKYLRFGRVAAKLDDFVNYLPSRLTALIMIFAAYLLGYDYKNAARIFRRDRRAHASPNSAQTESVCAGALGLRLGGDATYGGIVTSKPTIGDFIYEPGPEHILQAERLMYLTSFLCCVVFSALAYLLAFYTGFSGR